MVIPLVNFMSLLQGCFSDEPYREMFDYVDIGGECFKLTDTTEPPPKSSYELVCKNRAEFDKIFNDIIRNNNDAVRLIRTYLPYGRTQLVNMISGDKAPLIKVIEARRNALETTIKSSNHSIKNIQFEKYYNNLTKLLHDINEVGKNESVTPPYVLQNRVKKFTKEKIFYILLELAWKLTHSEKIVPGTEDEWMKLLNSMDKLSMGDLEKSIKGIPDPSNSIMRVDMDRVEKADAIIDAASPPDAAKELRKRLEAILTLLQTKKYLKSIQTNQFGPVVNHTTIDSSLSDNPRNTIIRRARQQGGGIPTVSLYAAMTPFYDYFTKKFGMITEIISAPSYPSLPTMATLLYLSEQIAQTKKAGLYRITNMDPTLFTFLKTQLETIDAYLTKANDDKKAAFVEAAALLPAMSIASLVNKYGEKGTYQNIKDVPSLRFLLKGVNLNHYENREEMTTDQSKDEIIAALDEFITEDNLYIGYPEAEIPMNVFEVSYETIDYTKTIPFQEIPSSYFTTHTSITLNTIMKVNTDLIYHQGMIALNMLEASKELLPT